MTSLCGRVHNCSILISFHANPKLLEATREQRQQQNKEHKENKLIIKNEKTTKIKRLQRSTHIKGPSKFISKYDYFGSRYNRVLNTVIYNVSTREFHPFT